MQDAGYSRFFLAYCVLPIAYCPLRIAYCLLPIAYCLLIIDGCSSSLFKHSFIGNRARGLFTGCAKII